MVFAAGFATAVYLLAPASEALKSVSYEDGVSYEDSHSKEGAEDSQELDSNQVIRIVKAGADKAMGFVKVTGQRTLRLIKQKMAESREVAKKPPD